MSDDVEYVTLDDFRGYAAAVLACDRRHVPFRDEGAADSALHSIQPVFGHDPYPDVPTKSAVLLFRLARNHPLADGNKRSATMASLEFAGLNGHECTGDLDVLENVIVDGAAGELSEDEFIAKFAPSITPIPRRGSGPARAPHVPRRGVSEERDRYRSR